MSPVGPRVRFAPSPTGSLHLGNARTALFNWLVARGSGGTLVLRIEDTDTEREQAGSEAGILEDLRWLGLDWDEGPEVGGDLGPYRQSERLDHYRRESERLLEGGRAYRCFCSGAELEAERSAQRKDGGPQGYSQRCRRMSPDEAAGREASGEPFALRFATVADGALPVPVVVEDRLRGRVVFDVHELGDAVILRPDGRPTYNFAVVVDDAAMGIDLVLRGDDHLSNTPRQALLFDALGRKRPAFAHLPMVRGADGSRLSKRHGAVSVAEYRRSGYPPEGLLNTLVLLGWSPGAEGAVLTRDEMIEGFSVEKINRSPSLFDPARLEWLSNQHIKLMPASRLTAEVGHRLVEAGRLPGEALDATAWLEGVAEMVRPSLHRLEEVLERTAGLFAPGGEPEDEQARQSLRAEGGAAVVAALVQEAEAAPPEDAEGWARIKSEVRRVTGLKGQNLFHPIRAALTGQVSGPELDRLLPLVTEGNRQFPDRIPTVAERARRTAAWLA